MNKVIDLVSQMTPHLINSDILIVILTANPDRSDESIIEQINLFKKTHTQPNNIINKYLQPYEAKRSDNIIHNIRKFVKPDDCKKALDDPQTKQCWKEAINSPEIREKIQVFKQKE